MLIRVINRIDDTLLNTDKILQDRAAFQDPIFNEFATRGVLSSLKTIEGKLDKLQLSKQISSPKQNEDDLKGKLMIKCNTPPIVEELLKDVSSKVDVMFDEISKTDEIFDQVENEDYLDEQEDNSTENSKYFKLLKRIIKKIRIPCSGKQNLFDKSFANSSLRLSHETYFNEKFSEISVIIQNISNAGDLRTIDNKLNQVILQLNNVKSTDLKNLTDLIHIHQNNLIELIEKKIVGTQFQKKVPKCSKDNNETIELGNIMPLKSNIYNCDDLVGDYKSGVYKISGSNLFNDHGRDYRLRFCEINENGIWTVIQRRGSEGSDKTNFNQNWDHYKNGFGHIEGDFWFGNEFINMLSSEQPLELRVELEDFDGNQAWAEYSTFLVESEEKNYRLIIGGYKGNASDSFSSHNFTMFSTYDRKNDEAADCCPCAIAYGGGWWFHK